MSILTGDDLINHYENPARHEIKMAAIAFDKAKRDAKEYCIGGGSFEFSVRVAMAARKSFSLVGRTGQFYPGNLYWLKGWHGRRVLARCLHLSPRPTEKEKWVEFFPIEFESTELEEEDVKTT